MVGAVGTIVNDSLSAGTQEFVKEEDEKCKRFIMNPEQVGKFEFSGCISAKQVLQSQ